MRGDRRLVRRSAELTVGADDALPVEFRIFSAGVNDSTEGPALFDDAAAAAVLAQFAREGVDQMIDLKHDSLSKRANVARADASDAMGWYKLAVRDGELWATGVTWTPEGEARLRAKKQRYTSPAFFVDKDDRVVEMINVALCSMPATLGALPLVAATKLAGSPARNVRTRSMDPAKVKAVIEALKAEDADAALGLLEDMLASAAGADEAAPAEEPAAPAEGEALAEGAEPPPSEEDDEERAMARALKKFARCEGAGEAIAKLERLAKRIEAHDADVAVRDASSRRELVGRLVTLGAETPATAWEGEPDERKPVARLASEPVAEMRARVALLEASGPRAERAPAKREVQLSAADQARADAIQDPVKRARYVALRKSRSAQ